MKNLSGYSESCNILELVFVLSHKQANIERGFSLNKNLPKQNTEALTITSWHKIKDYLLCNKIKLNTYSIPSKILESVQLSWQKYEVYLQENISKIKQDEKQKHHHSLKLGSKLKCLNINQLLLSKGSIFRYSELT